MRSSEEYNTFVDTHMSWNLFLIYNLNYSFLLWIFFSTYREKSKRIYTSHLPKSRAHASNVSEQTEWFHFFVLPSPSPVVATRTHSLSSSTSTLLHTQREIEKAPIVQSRAGILGAHASQSMTADFDVSPSWHHIIVERENEAIVRGKYTHCKPVCAAAAAAAAAQQPVMAKSLLFDRWRKPRR